MIRTLPEAPEIDAGSVVEATPLRQTIERVPPESTSSLDFVLAESDDAYQRDLRAERLEWIRDAARHHVESCEPYGRLAAATGFDPESLVTPEDLSLVPVLPSSIFKKRQVVSQVHGDLRHCRSSGTQGSVSTVLRDGRTLERFVATMLHGAKEFYDRHESREAFILAPPAEEADDLWFSYVLSLLDLVFDASFFVHDDQFEASELAEALGDVSPGTQPLLVGPPALLWDFCSHCDLHGRMDLGRLDGLVVTAGGWKARQGEAVDRATLTRRVEDALGVSRSSVRDYFNMVELNTVIYECDRGRKHIPPWLEVIVRRPSDMTPVPPGEEGVLTYLDPTATSYPGFIFSDDVGSVSSECRCGRVGQTLSIVRRLSKVEERGCALKMDRYRRPR